MLKKLTLTIIVLSVLVFAVLFLISPVDPVSWRPDPSHQLTGIFEKNEILDSVTFIGEGKLPEAEDITFDQLGWLYTGLNDGRIVKLHPDKPSNIIEVANTRGRPLGMRFDASGKLIVADAVLGLISVSSNGDIEILVDSFEGRKLLLVDHLDIATNGDIYFSDASAKFGLNNVLLDFVEASKTGAIYKYSVATQKTTKIMDTLFFSNGVALGPQDQFLWVAETGRARILKYHLAGAKQGQTEVFIDELPAMPDNLYYDEEGTLWVGLVAMRDWRVEKLAGFPMMRKIIGGIPTKWLKSKGGYGFAIGLNLSGEVTQNLQTPDAFTNITAAIKHQSKLYLGALESDSVAVYDLESADD